MSSPYVTTFDGVLGMYFVRDNVAGRRLEPRDATDRLNALTAERDRLREAVAWVLNDMVYAAPETFNSRAPVWWDRLMATGAARKDAPHDPR